MPNIVKKKVKKPWHQSCKKDWKNSVFSTSRGFLWRIQCVGRTLLVLFHPQLCHLQQGQILEHSLGVNTNFGRYCFSGSGIILPFIFWYRSGLIRVQVDPWILYSKFREYDSQLGEGRKFLKFAPPIPQPLWRPLDGSYHSFSGIRAIGSNLEPKENQIWTCADGQKMFCQDLHRLFSLFQEIVFC